MPLASLRRSTARPPMARPCASIGWPDSVVSVIEKASPRARKASTARSIALALPASSQLPKASTRREANTPTVAGSPSMAGSSEPAGQSTMICGSDNSSALARSSSSRSLAISLCDQLSKRAARARVRTSIIAVTTANKMTPKTTARKAISCWSILSCALKTSSCRASAGCSAAPAGRAEMAMLAARNPPIPCNSRQCA